MNSLTERQKDLLSAAVAEYIRTGSPVSSDDLRKRYRLAYSPATIRNELLNLSRRGFLSQPHTSAGRVPTDNGYRWYAAESATPMKPGKNELYSLHEALDAHFDDLNDFFRISTEIFSRLTQSLVIGGSLNEDMEPFYKSGFSQILSDPEFSDNNTRNKFGVMIDSIDQDMRSLIKGEDFSAPRVFIGQENPIREARPYSMIIKTLKRGKDTGVIAIVGSKRMRYDKGLSLLGVLDELIQEN